MLIGVDAVSVAVDLELRLNLGEAEDVLETVLVRVEVIEAVVVLVVVVDRVWIAVARGEAEIREDRVEVLLAVALSVTIAASLIRNLSCGGPVTSRISWSATLNVANRNRPNENRSILSVPVVLMGTGR